MLEWSRNLRQAFVRMGHVRYEARFGALGLIRVVLFGLRGLLVQQTGIVLRMVVLILRNKLVLLAGRTDRKQLVIAVGPQKGAARRRVVQGALP